MADGALVSVRGDYEYLAKRLKCLVELVQPF
jgi:hypothetical protein